MKKRLLSDILDIVKESVEIRALAGGEVSCCVSSGDGIVLSSWWLSAFRMIVLPPSSGEKCSCTGLHASRI
jgi:hypothetical protein